MRARGIDHRAVAATVALTCACAAGPGETPDETDTAPPAPACDLDAGEVITLATGYAQGTEGVAFSPDGRLLVTARERTVELDREGRELASWDTPATIGVAWWDGAFWITSGQDAAGEDAPALIELRDGVTTRHPLSGLRSPNFVVGTPWDTLLVAVPLVGADAIHEWDPATGETTLWSDDVPSPNGMAFSADGSTLFVATTFSPDEGLWTVAVDAGVAGAAAQLVDYPAGTSPDGIALEADGSVLVALNTGNRVERVTPDGASTSVADVAFPASIAHATAGWPRCAAVVTSLFSPDVFLVGTGALGAGLE